MTVSFCTCGHDEFEHTTSGGHCLAEFGTCPCEQFTWDQRTEEQDDGSR